MSVKISFKYALFLCLFAAIIGGCGEKGEHLPDVSGIKVELETHRFDKDIYAIDTNHIGEGLVKLHQKYPDFLDYFLDTLNAFGVHGNYNDTTRAIREGLHEYLSFKQFVQLEDTIKIVFPDTKETDAALTSAFKYFKYYFPTASIPKIMYLNFILTNHPAFVTDPTTYCVCLDMFLGEQFQYYRSVGVPDYMGPHLRKEYIPVSLFNAVYLSEHPFKPDDRTLLDLMIQRGKEQYFLHKIMPTTPDSVLFGFTKNQVEWCNKSESQLYNFFIQQSLLFNKSELAIMPYVVDGPFAKGIGAPTDPGRPTPGNIGTFVGYKIVSAYMANNPKVTLKELLEQQVEPARFLDAANYKPR